MAKALKNIELSLLISRSQNENLNKQAILKLTDGNLIQLHL